LTANEYNEGLVKAEQDIIDGQITSSEMLKKEVGK